MTEYFRSAIMGTKSTNSSTCVFVALFIHLKRLDNLNDDPFCSSNEQLDRWRVLEDQYMQALRDVIRAEENWRRESWNAKATTLKSEQSHLLWLHEEAQEKNRRALEEAGVRQEAINEDEQLLSDLMSSRSSTIEEAKKKMMDMETIKANLLKQLQVAHSCNEIA